MVMVAGSASRKVSESLRYDISEKEGIPPWCSSGRAYERRKSRKVAPCIKSFYPLRENIWQYLNDDKTSNSDIVERRKKKALKTIHRPKLGYAKLLVSLLLALGISITYLTSGNTSQLDLITKFLSETKLMSFLGIDSRSVNEECCHRMRHLALALRRAEQALSKAARIRKRSLILETGTQQIKTRNKRYISGTKAFKGRDTIEWGTQAALWGIVPLWHASPPPDTILSLRRPIPSDCWPIRGSSGEVIIELPSSLHADLIALEHISPDTAHSAPKNFTVFGILVNGTWIKAADGIYQHNKTAKQYFQLNNRNSPLQQIVFRVLSNQGNPKYTCIYRIHLYSSL